MTKPITTQRPSRECLEASLIDIGDKTGPIGYLALGLGGLLIIGMFAAYPLCTRANMKLEDEEITPVEAFDI